MNLMGPFPVSSQLNSYLLVFVDYYSKWVEIVPLRKATAGVVSKLMVKEIFTRWGVPDYVLSDQGPHFMSKTFSGTCKGWNVTQKFTMAYHPQTNFTE